MIPPIVSIHEQSQKNALLADKKHKELVSKNISSVWGHVSKIVEVVCLTALVFSLAAPFLMHVPSWSFGVMVGGSLVIGIPTLILEAKEQNAKREHEDFKKFLVIYKEMNLKDESSLHLAGEGDLPSLDPRLQSDRKAVFRPSTRDVKRVSDKYGLVESPGAKFFVAGRSANKLGVDIQKDFKKLKEELNKAKKADESLLNVLSILQKNGPERQYLPRELISQYEMDPERVKKELMANLNYFAIENDLTDLAPHYWLGIIKKIEGFGKHLTDITQELMVADENKFQALCLKLDKLIAKFCWKFDHSTSGPLKDFNQLIKSAVDNLKFEILECRRNGTNLDIDAVVAKQIEPLSELFKIMKQEYLEGRVKSEEAFFLQQFNYRKELEKDWINSDEAKHLYEKYQKALLDPDLDERFMTLKDHNGTLFQAIQLKEESIPVKVLEKCKRDAAFLRNLINENHFYSFLIELTAIDKRLDEIEKDPKGLDLGKLKALRDELGQFRGSKVQVRLNLNKDSFFKPVPEQYHQLQKKLNKWEKIEYRSIYSALYHYDQEIVSKERKLHLIVMAVSIALVVMYSLLKMDPWMNLMCQLGLIAFMFGTNYAGKHIQRLRKEIRVLKMRQYFIEHPEMMNRLPPLPQVKEKLDQLKRLDIPTFIGYEQISRVLVDL